MTEPQSTNVPLTGRGQLAAAAARLNQAHAVQGERFPALRHARIMRNSVTVAQRAETLQLEDRDYRFLVGWLISAEPTATDDALDALERFRDTRTKG